MKKLVVFYSLDGNTKFISENIAEEIGADILELKPVKDITKNKVMKFVVGGGPGKIFEKMEDALKENNILGKIEFKDPLKHEKESDAEKARNWAKELLDN